MRPTTCKHLAQILVWNLLLIGESRFVLARRGLPFVCCLLLLRCCVFTGDRRRGNYNRYGSVAQFFTSLCVQFFWFIS